MRDYLIGLGFFLTYEALSWPVRLALLPMPMRAELRRFLSRVAGVPTLAMVIWLAAHAGLPLGPLTGWIVYGLALAAAALLCLAQGIRPRWLEVIRPVAARRRWKQELLLEAFGPFLFFTYLAFRRWAPEMTTPALDGSGAEKFANAMFFWSAFHARTLPPDDYWLSGHPQIYYYWGHFFWAWVGRMGGFPGEYVIALALARLTALIGESGHLLLRAFGARPRAALIGAFFLTWAGNPQAFLTALDQYDYHVGRSLEPLERRGFLFAPAYLRGLREKEWRFVDYPFWNPSRVLSQPRASGQTIPGTITEFTAWSAILGDFHAHHLALPWTIGLVALLLGGDRWFFLDRRRRGRGFSAGGERNREKGPPPGEGARSKAAFGDGQSAPGLRFLLWAGLGMVLAGAATLANLWIGPLIALTPALAVLGRRGLGWRGWSARLAFWLILGAALGAGAYLIRQPASGLRRTPPRESSASQKGVWETIRSRAEDVPIKRLPPINRSSTRELIRMWGFHAGLLGLAIVVAAARRRPTIPQALLLGGAIGIAAAQWRLLTEEPGLLWVALATATLALAGGRRPWFRREAMIATAGACLLLGGLEMLYIQDTMGSGWLARYNSYFKLSYPAWPVLGAGAWIGVVRVWQLRAPMPVRAGLRTFLILMIPPAMAMALFGIPARLLQARIGDKSPRGPTLHAGAWLSNRPGYEAESALLQWIRDNVPPRERVAEAALPAAYGYMGRVASLAGRPVLLGWSHHETQWRGAAAGRPIEEAVRRTRAIYEAPTADALRQAAREAGLRWIVLGKTEIEHYGRERAAEIYQTLRQAAVARAWYPPERPEAFIFEIPRAEGE